jgi:hypothetical protein
MPINDPGNAGTASRPEPTIPVSTGPDDTGRRAMALAVSIITGVALFPAAYAIVDTNLTAGILTIVGWLGLMIIAGGIVNYRHGSPRRR